MPKQLWWLGLLVLAGATSAFADPAADFKASDKNGDSLLQPDEFRAFIDIQADNGNKTAQRVKSFRAYDRAFSRIDADEDGEISGEELRAIAALD